MPCMNKYHFYPYQLPPTLHPRRFKLTGCRVKFCSVFSKATRIFYWDCMKAYEGIYELRAKEFSS